MRQKRGKTMKKANLYAGITLAATTAMMFYCHPARTAVFFFCLGAFEWWLVLWLIRKADEPKPPWYPFIVAAAIAIGCLLFGLLGGMRGSSGSGYSDDASYDPIHNPRDP